MPFVEGELPVKYLGVPFISSRLLNKDCKILVKELRTVVGIGRISLYLMMVSFKTFSNICVVSFGVMASSSVVNLKLLKKIYVFLKVRVALVSVVLRWIHTYKLKGHSFWDIPIKSDLSWGWLKHLHIRDLVKPFFWITMGNGWLWLQAWLLKASDLGLISVLTIINSWPDLVQWRDLNSVLSCFSVGLLGKPLDREVLKSWHSVVWFSHCIPRHAVHLWLVMRNSLKTQDKLRKWDAGVGIDLNPLQCAFRSGQLDSHAHLFFECSYSSKVWYLVRPLACMENVPPHLHDIIADCFMVHVEVVVWFQEPRRELPLSVVLYFPPPRFCPVGFTWKDSARIIMEALDEFKGSSGLVLSIPKSTIFFYNVVNHVKNSILNIMPFAEGRPDEAAKIAKGGLPVKSVISSMQVYWASVLTISKGIILDIHRLIRGFLWCNGEYKRGKAKVAWSDICLPKSEDGLGLRSLEIFNMALMTTHIWNIVSNKELLWVRWIYTYKLIVPPFFWANLGNGRNTSIWFDNWCSYCLLIRFLTGKDISREGFSIQDCVIDMISNDGWKLPQSWLLKAPDLGLVSVPNLVANKSDVPRWQN
uniref:Reverse transcriptase zinc-binding domain-containing protein n=1 Tax=Tanacetum cinerariifolium TaxID=118510 RepID=A0A6L2NNC4_TANCI|nr:hypothetical protein [Tanacetum cinerariifolium]